MPPMQTCGFYNDAARLRGHSLRSASPLPRTLLITAFPVASLRISCTPHASHLWRLYDFYSRVAVIGIFQRNVEMLGFFPTFVVWSAVGVNDEEAMIALKFNVVQLLALG